MNRNRGLWRRWILGLVLGMLAGPLPGQGDGEGRGIRVVEVKTPGGEGFLYRESHALLLGNATYQDRVWADLPQIPGELEELRAELVRQGFVIYGGRVHLDLTKKEMLELVEEFVTEHGVGNRVAEDRLLVFYSGHGESEGDRGFLVPVEAPSSRGDWDDFRKAAVEMARVESWAKRIEAKHALFAFDSCFSGAVFTQKGTKDIPPHVTMGASKPARQFLTAGSKDETVPAVSAFMPYFIRGIAGEADMGDRDGFVTFGELSEYVRAQVARAVGTHVQAGALPHPYDQGDVVFAFGTGRAAVPPVMSPAAAMLTPVPMPAPAPAPAPVSTPAGAGIAGARAGETRTIGGIEMVWCPPGTFLMGSPDTEADRSYDETPHEVTLTKGLWLAKTECTQGQWTAVMGSNPSFFKGDDLPVEQVSWEDATAWCQKMNTSARDLPPGMKWTLPTEAQWEYACRAGTTGPYAGTSLDALGWYIENAGAKTNPVGKKRPNPWGLCDMHGNVIEWCSDSYDSAYVTSSAAKRDPQGPTTVPLRMARGGSWSVYAQNCRSAFRSRDTLGNRLNNLGFRPAVSLP